MDKPSKYSLQTLHLTFSHRIFSREIPNWRGAFIEMAGWEDDLFHNHQNSQERDGYLYRYPLVQYRFYKGRAGLFALNEGVEAIQKVLTTSDWMLNWEGQKVYLQVEDLKMNEYKLKIIPDRKPYKLFKWLALNQDNYEKWQACKGIKARIDLLERILGSNLISLCKGLNWRPEERIEVNIQEIRHTEMVRYHETKLLSFNIVYDTNVLLPPGIAIGKGVSHGFGWQMPVRKRMEKAPKLMMELEKKER